MPILARVLAECKGEEGQYAVPKVLFRHAPSGRLEMSNLPGLAQNRHGFSRIHTDKPNVGETTDEKDVFPV
jgi:hypothetical protein